jgi:hypothetical protein
MVISLGTRGLASEYQNLPLSASIFREFYQVNKFNLTESRQILQSFKAFATSSQLVDWLDIAR